MRKWEGERECYVHEKKECKGRAKKMLRMNVTKVKSKYRDEFLIRYSRDLYIYYIY